MNEYADQAGAEVLVVMPGMVYKGVLEAADGESISVRISTKVDSKVYRLPAAKVKKVTVLCGPVAGVAR